MEVWWCWNDSFQPQQLPAGAGSLLFVCPLSFSGSGERPQWEMMASGVIGSVCDTRHPGCDSSLGRGPCPLTLTVRMTLTYTAKVAEAAHGEMAGMLNRSAAFWISHESWPSVSHPSLNTLVFSIVGHQRHGSPCSGALSWPNFWNLFSKNWVKRSSLL